VGKTTPLRGALEITSLEVTRSHSKNRSSTVCARSQTQIKEEMRPHFGVGLRALLRQDQHHSGGECRDTETATLMVRAGLTGPFGLFDVAHQRRCRAMRGDRMGVEPTCSRQSGRGAGPAVLVRTIAPTASVPSGPAAVSPELKWSRRRRAAAIVGRVGLQRVKQSGYAAAKRSSS